MHKDPDVIVGKGLSDEQEGYVKGDDKINCAIHFLPKR